MWGHLHRSEQEEAFHTHPVHIHVPSTLPISLSHKHLYLDLPSRVGVHTQAPWGLSSGSQRKKRPIKALVVGPGPAGQCILSLGIPDMFWKVGDKGFDCVHTSLVPLDSLPHGQWHGRNRARDRPSQGKDGAGTSLPGLRLIVLRSLI